MNKKDLVKNVLGYGKAALKVVGTAMCFEVGMELADKAMKSVHNAVEFYGEKAQQAKATIKQRRADRKASKESE